jgi:hypothetical protein
MKKKQQRPLLKVVTAEPVGKSMKKKKDGKEAVRPFDIQPPESIMTIPNSSLESLPSYSTPMPEWKKNFHDWKYNKSIQDISEEDLWHCLKQSMTELKEIDFRIQYYLDEIFAYQLLKEDRHEHED